MVNISAGQIVEYWKISQFEKKNYGAEMYGPHSICLIQKLACIMEKCEKKPSYLDWSHGCYQVSCSLQGLKVLGSGYFICV